MTQDGFYLSQASQMQKKNLFSAIGQLLKNVLTLLVM
jgi:hypothetical protein